MITFIISIAVLLLGYFCYSGFIEKIGGADQNRLFTSVPLFLVGFLLTRIDFGIAAAVTALAGFLYYKQKIAGLPDTKKMTGSTGKIKSI